MNIKIYQAPKVHYTIIPNEILKNSALSDGAKILAFYLMSLPQNWNIHWGQVAKALNKSLSTISKYKTELVHNGYLLISQAKETTGRFQSKTCLSFKIFNTEKIEQNQDSFNPIEQKKNAQNKESLPQRNLTAYGKTANIINKEYFVENKEIVIAQNIFPIHELFSNESLKVNIQNQKEKLSDFLSGAELEVAKEWVQYRKENFKIPAFKSIKKLKIAKEKGWDLQACIKRAIANDYRGLFETKPYAIKQPQTKARFQNQKELEITKEIYQNLVLQGWKFGDSLENMRVGGKRVKIQGNRFYYDDRIQDAL